MVERRNLADRIFYDIPRMSEEEAEDLAAKEIRAWYDSGSDVTCTLLEWLGVNLIEYRDWIERRRTFQKIVLDRCN